MKQTSPRTQLYFCTVVAVAVSALISFGCSEADDEIADSPSTSWEDPREDSEWESTPTGAESDWSEPTGTDVDAGRVDIDKDEPIPRATLIDDFQAADLSSQLAAAMTAQHRMLPFPATLSKVADFSAPLTVYVDLTQRDTKPEQLITNFESFEDFASCLHWDYGDSIYDPRHAGNCVADGEMAEALLGYRGAIESSVDSCYRGCCHFDYGEPVDQGLRIRTLCYNEVEDDRLVVSELFLDRSGSRLDVLAERQRNRALQLAWAFGRSEPSELGHFFGEQTEIEVHLDAERNIEADESFELTFARVGDFLACLGESPDQLSEQGRPGCDVPQEVASYLSAPRHAYLGVEPCEDGCCEVVGGNALHNTLFLEGQVCFGDDDVEKPVVQSLDLRWSW